MKYDVPLNIHDFFFFFLKLCHLIALYAWCCIPLCENDKSPVSHVRNCFALSLSVAARAHAQRNARYRETLILLPVFFPVFQGFARNLSVWPRWCNGDVSCWKPLVGGVNLSNFHVLALLFVRATQAACDFNVSDARRHCEDKPSALFFIWPFWYSLWVQPLGPFQLSKDE